MTALSVYPPRARSGATALELIALRAAGAVARAVERRVARRDERRERMLEQLRAAQTRRADPAAIDHAMAQLGMRLR